MGGTEAKRLVKQIRGELDIEEGQSTALMEALEVINSQIRLTRSYLKLLENEVDALISKEGKDE